MHSLTISLVFVSLLTFTANGQTFKVAPTAATATAIDSTSITIESAQFTAFASRTGSLYINRVSASGKAYKQYLGVKTSHTVELNGSLVPVWANKSADKLKDGEVLKYHAFKLGRTGYPSRVKLIME